MLSLLPKTLSSICHSVSNSSFKCQVPFPKIFLNSAPTYLILPTIDFLPLLMSIPRCNNIFFCVIETYYSFDVDCPPKVPEFKGFVPKVASYWEWSYRPIRGRVLWKVHRSLKACLEKLCDHCPSSFFFSDFASWLMRSVVCSAMPSYHDILPRHRSQSYGATQSCTRSSKTINQNKTL